MCNENLLFDHLALSSNKPRNHVEGQFLIFEFGEVLFFEFLEPPVKLRGFQQQEYYHDTLVQHAFALEQMELAST